MKTKEMEALADKVCREELGQEPDNENMAFRKAMVHGMVKWDEYASQFQQEWIPVEEETAREPIQDALYATGRFTKDECDVLSDGILRYINDANLVFVPQPYNPTTK